MNQNEKVNSNQALQKIEESINKGREIAQAGKEGIQTIQNTVGNVNTAINKANGLVDNVKELSNTYLESKRIQKDTILGLEKIQKNHETINKHIDTEYKKQKQQMDKASDVVDAGLASDNIEKIREGLAAMTATANHNPMADLKRSLDEDIDQDYLDDDFIIEI